MIDDVKRDAEHRMQGAIEALSRDLSGVRTGRASPALVERLQVDYYGTSTPLNQIAGISAPEARLIVIQPWDRGSINAIEKAIQQSELSLTPSNDGQVIRLPIPQLTEERRRDLVKLVKNKVEDARIAVRNVRRDAMDHTKDLMKEKLIGEDEERRAESEIQAMTTKYIEMVDELGKAKEAEVLDV
jgi:ribosome recycling factor